MNRIFGTAVLKIMKQLQSTFCFAQKWEQPS